MNVTHHCQLDLFLLPDTTRKQPKNLKEQYLANTRCLSQVAELSIAYSEHVKPSDRKKITGSKDIADILMPKFSRFVDIREAFYCVYLNRANKVIGIIEISTGGVAGTVADPKLILFGALNSLACGIILAHNHPSGNLTPSQADIDLTRKVKEAAKFMEIQVLDHVILTSEKYYSFADEGMI